jgi:hypothetical protein
MSMFQGQTRTNPINVEVVDSSASTLYGNSWQETTTGEEMLRVNFPDVLEKGIVKIAFGLPTATKKLPIVSLTNIPKLEKIPPLATIEEVRGMLSKAGDELQLQGGSRSSRPLEPWGAEISNFGAVNIDVISILTKIFQAKEFVRDLRDLLGWIKKDISKLDREFSQWLENILLNQPGIMHYKFRSMLQFEMSIRSVAFLSMERFIDDEAVGGIMELFTKHYGADGHYLFIPPLILEAWRRNLRVTADPR